MIYACRCENVTFTLTCRLIFAYTDLIMGKE